MFTLQPRKRPVLDLQGETLTEQSHKESCSMQHIVAKYRKTGILDHLNSYKGSYMDLPDSYSFHEAQNIIAQAKSMFETVPSHIRADFDNDAAKYLEFIQNPENKEQIDAYGLDSSHFPSQEDSHVPVPQHQNSPKIADTANAELSAPTEPSTPTPT